MENQRTKKNSPVPYRFFTARAMNHCCEISFLSFKCDGLQAADQRSRTEGCPPPESCLQRSFFFFFLAGWVRWQRKGELLSLSCLSELSHNTSSTPPKSLSVSMTALHTYISVTEGQNPEKIVVWVMHTFLRGG